MEPYLYLQKIAGEVDSMDDREVMNNVLDELVFIYELLDPEHQDLANDLINKISGQYKKTE
jgi:hypothetical protein